MSLEAITWVLKDAPGVPAQCVSVLIGLANHADEDGCGAYPSAGTLAKYARKSKRQVHYDLDALAEAKLIRPGDQSLVVHLPVNRRPVVYDLALERTAESEVQPTSPPVDVQPTAGMKPTAPQKPTAPHTADDLQEDAGMQSTAPQSPNFRGATHFPLGVQPTADKPSNEPTEEAEVGEGGSGGGNSARPRRARGIAAHRIPDDFRVTPEMVEWHHDNTPHVDGRRETEKFIDHWHSASGANARKRDWVAAWRNWMRKADDDLGRHGRGASSRPSATATNPHAEHRTRR